MVNVALYKDKKKEVIKKWQGADTQYHTIGVRTASTGQKKEEVGAVINITGGPQYCVAVK
jgi:hypothetical protein